MQVTNTTLVDAPLPDTQGARLNAIRIALILMGALIALPAFVMGAKLNEAMGTRDSMIAAGAGGFILSCIAASAAVIGSRSRLSSYQLILAAFGYRGGKLVNACLSVVMVGWFAVVASLFGDAALRAAGGLVTLNASTWVAIGCVLMTATTLTGFRALDILAMLTTPLKVILLVATVVASWTLTHGSGLWVAPAHHQLTIPQGISFVVGGVIVGALLTPDLARLATTRFQAALACFLAFAVGQPLVLILTGIPARLAGESDLVLIMLRLGLGLPAILIVVLAAWSSNAYNLYAITLVFRTLTHHAVWKLAAFGGALGAVLALAGLAQRLTPFLLVLSVAIPPIAGVYIAAYYIAWGRGEPQVRRAWRVDSLLAWLAGVAAAGLGFSLSGVTAVDSLVVAMVAYVALH
ncbi:MAG TPA: cytosine permease, partial [Steroidobacteraceae bacterium]